jgi:hypothetical protein
MADQPVPPTPRPWRVSAGWPGRPSMTCRPLMTCDCDDVGQAAALALVLAIFWPDLAVWCRRPAPSAGTSAAGESGAWRAA